MYEWSVILRMGCAQERLRITNKNIVKMHMARLPRHYLFVVWLTQLAR